MSGELVPSDRVLVGAALHECLTALHVLRQAVASLNERPPRDGVQLAHLGPDHAADRLKVSALLEMAWHALKNADELNRR